VVLFALGTGASLAQDTSTPAADNNATIGSAAPTALDSSSTDDSTSNPNAEPSPALEKDAQSARAAKRSTRRHTTPAPANTVEIAPTETVEVAPTKTVEIKDTGERTVCEDVGLPGSRMVVSKRCHTYNIYDRSDMRLAEEKKEQTKRPSRSCAAWRTTSNASSANASGTANVQSPRWLSARTSARGFHISQLRCGERERARQP
jgi:hypothetical protein